MKYISSYMYLENINSDGIYSIPCKEHIKNVLQEIIPNNINLDEQGIILQNEIKKWWDENKEKTVWDTNEYRYKWK